MNKINTNRLEQFLLSLSKDSTDALISIKNELRFNKDTNRCLHQILYHLTLNKCFITSKEELDEFIESLKEAFKSANLRTDDISYTLNHYYSFKDECDSFKPDLLTLRFIFSSFARMYGSLTDKICFKLIESFYPKYMYEEFKEDINCIKDTTTKQFNFEIKTINDITYFYSDRLGHDILVITLLDSQNECDFEYYIPKSWKELIASSKKLNDKCSEYLLEINEILKKDNQDISLQVIKKIDERLIDNTIECTASYINLDYMFKLIPSLTLSLELLDKLNDLYLESQQWILKGYSINSLVKYHPEVKNKKDAIKAFDMGDNFWKPYSPKFLIESSKFFRMLKNSGKIAKEANRLLAVEYKS